MLDGADPWASFQTAATAAKCGGDWLAERAGFPPDPVRGDLERRGFAFLSEEDVLRCRDTLRLATRSIEQEPGLAAIVNAEVSAVFLLSAGEAFDISHSEPRWPGWVFVSVPSAPGEVSALRAAENIVHEALHHQLTRIEDRVALVADLESKLASPWKNEPRHMQGILHGLYVFVCISRFFERLRDAGAVGEEGTAYVDRRLTEIGEEVRAVSLGELKSGLTPNGQAFLRKLCWRH